ncbi:myophilin-like [Dendronephthya gigantea]|uniref:myophilin-like n=1 Tax=Dendronephthya gigantea TaxID=151771 RepID=UPI00106942EE|nr:myophilin-like [Dendronephthya gigantea]
MSHRAQPAGIAAEARRKLDAKYDPNAEQNARLWMEDVTGILLMNPGDDVQTIEQLNEWRMNPLGQKEFHKALKDGVLICKLMNALKEGSVPKINEGAGNSYKQMENISNFLKAALAYGCEKGDLFQTVELHEGRDMGQVLNGIYAVGRQAQDKITDEAFPKLGPRQAKYNPRNFTKEQLEKGKHVCALRF